jgi:prefoldin subunit 5
MKNVLVKITVDFFVTAETEADAAALVKDALAKVKNGIYAERGAAGVTGVMLRSLDVSPK